MEAITQLVAESLARHGFDRPVDPRRLQWSRWFRCDSPHSLLVVPSKPGIFAIAEEIMDLGPGIAPAANIADVGTAALGCPAERSSAAAELPQRRMLAVLQFSEDDDMAFTLDRMFTRINPMRARLATGRCFVRFVVIDDQSQRRSICAALNQWMLSSAEKASGIGMEFQSSLELTDCRDKARVGRTLLSDSPDRFSSPTQGTQPGQEADALHSPLYPDSGAGKNLHCPHPLPSGF